MDVTELRKNIINRWGVRCSDNEQANLLITLAIDEMLKAGYSLPVEKKTELFIGQADKERATAAGKWLRLMELRAKQPDKDILG